MTDQISGPNDQRCRVSTEGDRKAYVRDWIARRLKPGGLAGGGLVGTLLTLPMIAAAQAADQFVSAARIDGVTNVRAMSDGTAQLVMTNGTTISVPASDVQVAANGDVLVSARVEEIAAEVMAAGGGGGAGGGAIIAGAVGAGALAAAAGGGGGGGGDGGSLPVINSATLGAGGGITNGDVGLDALFDASTVEVTLTDEAGNETTQTVPVDDDGNWSFPFAPEQDPPQGRVTVTATSLDGDGNELETISQDVLIDTIAPTITITDTGVGGDTLNLAEQDAGITVTGTTDAEDGQTVTVTLDGADFTGTVSDGAWSVDIPASGLAGLDPAATDVAVTAAVEDAAGNAGDTSETILLDLAAPTISLDDVSGDNQIGLLDAQSDLEITGATDAEAGQEVTVTFDGQDFTGTVGSGGGSSAEPNAWSVTVPQSAVEAVEAGAEDGLASVDVSATVADAAGNSAVDPAARTITADFRGPSITIDDIAGDGVINIEESNDPGGITISGSTNNVPENQPVEVTIDGTALPTVPTNADGSWTLTVPRGDASLPADGASVTVTADVSDGETEATAQADLSVDTSAPSIAIATVAAGGAALGPVMSIAESGADLSISGTTTDAEADQTVTVALGGETFTTTTDGTNWSLTIANDDLPDSLDGTLANDGTNVTIEASVTDRAGNGSNTAQSPFVTDFAPPVLDVDALAIGDSLNIAEAAGEVEVTGTVSGHDDNPVTVSVGGVDASATVETNGDWTATFAPNALDGLDEGDTRFTVSTQDDAGNTTSVDSEGFALDLTAPTIAITDTGVGPAGVLNIADQSAGITVEGIATGADDQEVTVTLSGVAAATPITATGTVTGGTFAVAFDDTDLAGIGAWSMATVTAEVSDAAGNSATPATDSFDIDVTAPTIAFDDPPPAGFVLDIAERADADGIDFTTTGTAPGDTVTLTFTRDDGSGTVDFTRSETIGNIPSDTGVFTLPLTPDDLAQLEDETAYTARISVSDAAGNSAAPDSFGLETDFAPSLTIDEIGEDGAVDISDTAGAAITGTTLGVEQNQQVTVTATGATSGLVLDTTALVATDGTWSAPVSQDFFEGIMPGETFTVEATVTNAAGRTATDAQAGIDAYLPAVYAVANTDEAGTTLGMTAFAAEGLDAGQGIDAIMSFDPADATYVLGSETSEFDGFFIVNANDAATGTVIFGGGNQAAVDQLPEGEPVFGFDMEDQGAGPITLSFVDELQGGPTELQIGASGADALTAHNTDSVIQAKGGDDQIDVSATGTNIVVFGLDQAANGTDTVTGFTTGTGFQADQIAFLGQADLRGDGDVTDTLASGEALDAHAGFVIFTTALADTGDTTIETALEGLTGEQAGDVFYALAGDGSDAALVRATVNGADDIATERLADFAGIGDLGNLSEDNVVLPDPASQPMA